MFSWRPRVKEKNANVHPPGPKGIPLLGSLFEARRDPLRFVRMMTQDHGDIVYFRIGPQTGYHLNRPEYVQHVLQDNHTNYTKLNYNFELLKAGLGEGLITTSGEQWLWQRRMVQPAFHRNQLARFGNVARQATQDMLIRWQTRRMDRHPFDMADEMIRLTLRIVGEALFSVDLEPHSETIAANFAHLNEDLAYRFRTIIVPPLWVPTRRNLAFWRNRAELDRIVYAMIGRRRMQRTQRDDLLGLLLNARDEQSGQSMTARQVRDQVMTLMLAGHETTAALLTWTWYILAVHPAVQARLRQELDKVLDDRQPTFDDLSHLEYMDSVLHEALRLYPPVWFFNRTAAEDDQIGGYRIPAGSNVTISPYTLHRHPSLWRHPDQVHPQRFAARRSGARHRYAYIPFGGGPRICIGRAFAMTEAKLILAAVAQRYRCTLISDQAVEPEPLITMRPRCGLMVRMHDAR